MSQPAGQLASREMQIKKVAPTVEPTLAAGSSIELLAGRVLAMQPSQPMAMLTANAISSFTFALKAPSSTAFLCRRAKPDIDQPLRSAYEITVTPINQN